MNDLFLRVCRGEQTERPPVWFMRQAGRFMAEYRAIRANHTLLEICAQPELAAEVTLQPVQAFGVDAAILFADILLPLAPMGAPFHFAAGEGPVFESPVRTRADVARLRPVDPEESLGHVLQAIRIIRERLNGKVPLIGFGGAPFTLASYLVEGGKSSHFALTKRLMYGDPELWHTLLDQVTTVVIAYLRAQAAAGAQALQVFDSWVGQLSPWDYRAYVLPHQRRLFAELADLDVPLIHFGTGTATLLGVMQEAGGTVFGIDWRTPFAQARATLGAATPLQGNLDPILLQAPWSVLQAAVRRTVADGSGGPHIFNLGHGILPETDPDMVKRVVEELHAQASR